VYDGSKATAAPAVRWGGAMFRVIKASFIVIILLTVFTASPTANYLPCIPVLISQVYADSSESWTLQDGVLLSTTQGMAIALDSADFHDMVINIANGTVNSSHNIPVNYTDAYGSFNGSVKYTLQGTYSGSAGMSGQYTMYIDGTLSGKGNTQLFKLAYTGAFSGPGGLSVGKTVKVSFAMAYPVPIPGGEGNGNPKSYPFDLTFTVATGKSAVPSVTPGTGSNQLPSVTKGDHNGDGRVTELDALAALKMSVKELPEDLNLDMDGNGKVTAADARLILKQALGK
jgi:hypothetical protein